MAGAFAIVCVIEWLAGREQLSFVRPAATAPAHPVVEAQRADDTDEHDSLGWTAFEEAQEPSDAMTIIGSPARDDEPVVETDPEPEPEPEPLPEEPELPPAAEAEVEAARPSPVAGGAAATTATTRPAPSRSCRGTSGCSLPRMSRHTSDPWEEGFDTPGTTDEADEPAFVEDEAPRGFRRR